MLLAHGALWNTFVGIGWAPTLWALAQQATPELYHAFTAIRQALGRPHVSLVIERVYETLRTVNFSSAICEPLASELRVLPVPDVGHALADVALVEVTGEGNPGHLADTALLRPSESSEGMCHRFHAQYERKIANDFNTCPLCPELVEG